MSDQSVDLLLDRASRDAEGRRRLRALHNDSLAITGALERLRAVLKAWDDDAACGPALIADDDRGDPRGTVGWSAFVNLYEAHKNVVDTTTILAEAYKAEREKGGAA